jgi:hypothetical protein
VRIFVGIIAGLGLVSAALGQSTLDHPVGEFVSYGADSGSIDNPADDPVIVFAEEVFVEDAAWMRVHFSEVSLDDGAADREGSYLRLTAVLDGEVQELDAQGMRMWENASAFFNGDALYVELIAGPRSTGNRIAIEQVMVEFDTIETAGTCGICGADDRVPSFEEWAARILPVGCTASVYNTNSCLVSAGHCAGSGQVIQFRVPPSSSGCALRQPGIAEQFPILQFQFQNNGPGADWQVMTSGTNNLGQKPYDRYHVFRPMAALPASNGNAVVNWGYGVDTECVRTQTQQTHSGSIVGRNATYYDFMIDATFGNSGSSILKNDEIVGIVSHCREGCPNIATRHDLAVFAQARQNLCDSSNRAELPFFDDFPEIEIDRNLWSVVEGAGISNRHEGVAPSEPFVVNFDNTDLIESVLMDATGLQSVLLQYYFQRSSTTEEEDDLVVEFQDAGENWIEISRQLGGGEGMTTFELVSLPLPPEALHVDLRIRIRSEGNAADDDWFVDDVAVMENTDRQPPAPDPMSFSAPPAPLSSSSMTMTAILATDDESDVEYFFDYDEAVGGGGHDSAWQSSRTYVDTGLLANLPQSYRVKARDIAGNETAYSGFESASTMIETPTLAPIVVAGQGSISIITVQSFSWLTFGQSGLFFDSTTDGGDAGINEWIQSTVDVAVGLDPDKRYSFRLKARNRDGVETAYSPEAAVATFANVPNPPMLAGAGCDAMRVTIDGNGNPAGTVYAIQCTDTDPVDGAWDGMYVGADGLPTGSPVWRTSGDWGAMLVQGLTAETTYSFAATARNQDGVETAQGEAASLGTGTCGDCVRNPAWQCDGDVDGDGQVNPVDSGLVQSAFGSGDDQDLCNYDIDCDGQVNPVDSGIVQSLFGSCEPVRAVCP